MRIELQEITVRELTKGYIDDQENRAKGYNGKLDIRDYPRKLDSIAGQVELKVSKLESSPLKLQLSNAINAGRHLLKKHWVKRIWMGLPSGVLGLGKYEISAFHN